MKPQSVAEITEYLEEIENLLTLLGENPFKVRAYEKAAVAISKMNLEELMAHAETKSLSQIPSIGKGIAEALAPYILTGDRAAAVELKTKVSPALFELTRIAGLGPKKAKVLIEELGISTLGELEYACRENRLVHLKGFGEKLQQKVLEGLEFLKSNRGKMNISDAFPLAEGLLTVLTNVVSESQEAATQGLRISEAGALRRRLEVIEAIDFLVELPLGEQSMRSLRAVIDQAVEKWKASHLSELGQTPVNIHYATGTEWAYELFVKTGSSEHVASLRALPDVSAETITLGAERTQNDTDARVYVEKGLPWLPPEVRETGEEVTLAQQGKFPDLLPWDGVEGVFHLHTDRSDGTATLEQMVAAAASRGLKYIGVSDHSQSAFYAQGLKLPTLLEQEAEVREVQARFPQMRIFWGIESDILIDGALDYADEVLDRFDFVIGSIHSRFGMDRAAMTKRILAALDSPHLDFLGHLTGRLLLGREPYDLDIEAVVEKAAAKGVAIEINANPARLDIDWRYGHLLRREKCLVSVNPDAHSTDGFDDVKYGVAVARKALLPKSLVLNARSTTEVEQWLRRKN